MYRLKLRNFQSDDFDAFHAAHSDFETVKMTASWPWPPDPGFTRMRMTTPEAKAGMVNVIALDGAYIGSVAIIHGEMGYGIAKPFWGRGIATWAVAQKLAQVFGAGKDQRIIAGVWQCNQASVKVLRKNGFVKTGEEIAFCKARNSDRRADLFELTRPQWRSRS